MFACHCNLALILRGKLNPFWFSIVLSSGPTLLFGKGSFLQKHILDFVWPAKAASFRFCVSIWLVKCMLIWSAYWISAISLKINVIICAFWGLLMSFDHQSIAQPIRDVSSNDYYTYKVEKANSSIFLLILSFILQFLIMYILEHSELFLARFWRKHCWIIFLTTPTFVWLLFTTFL